MIIAHKMDNFFDAFVRYKAIFSTQWMFGGFSLYTLPAQSSTIEYIVNLVDGQLLLTQNSIPLHGEKLFYPSVCKPFRIIVILFVITSKILVRAMAGEIRALLQTIQFRYNFGRKIPEFHIEEATITYSNRDYRFHKNRKSQQLFFQISELDRKP